MKKLSVALLLCAALLSAPFSKLFAQTDQQQRVRAACMLAFGRDAYPGEIANAAKIGNASVSQLIAANQQYFKQDVAGHNWTIDRAYQDALGRHATADELKNWRAGQDTYATLMKNHITWLQGNPAEYDKVIKGSYQFVFGRQPSAGELTYWKGQGVVSYLLLVGFHQDWKRRNPSNPQENGNAVNLLNQSNISTVMLSPVIANEARIATGLVASGGGNLVASGGGNLVASGGGNLVASGGGNLVASGGGN